MHLQECRVPFGNGNFFEHDSLPYCETHFHAHRGSLCAGCHKPVTGRCITAMYRKYHPEHFVCSFCQCQLNKGTFKEEGDKPYCHPCFVRLFSWDNSDSFSSITVKPTGLRSGEGLWNFFAFFPFEIAYWCILSAWVAFYSDMLVGCHICWPAMSAETEVTKPISRRANGTQR